MFILEEEGGELYDRVQEQNLNRQYELLTNCIEIGLLKGPVSFDKYLLWALNRRGCQYFAVWWTVQA